MAPLKTRSSAHNLAGVAKFFKFFATFLFIPFHCSAPERELRACAKYFLVYWAILGPFLTALHTLSSLFTLLHLIAHFSSCHSSACDDVNALVGLALSNILLHTNASITAYGISIAKNYDEVLHLCNQIFRYRSHFVKGEVCIISRGAYNFQMGKLLSNNDFRCRSRSAQRCSGAQATGRNFLYSHLLQRCTLHFTAGKTSVSILGSTFPLENHYGAYYICAS